MDTATTTITTTTPLVDTVTTTIIVSSMVITISDSSSISSIEPSTASNSAVYYNKMWLITIGIITVSTTSPVSSTNTEYMTQPNSITQSTSLSTSQL